MSAGPALAAQIAESLRARCAHDIMPEAGLLAGVVIPPIEEGVSKWERALKALAGKATATRVGCRCLLILQAAY